jgi:arabinose-5-phosphate isomerase
MILKNKDEIKQIGIRTIVQEWNAIGQLPDQVNDDFALAVSEIIQCKGRVIVTGIGKSANIATKIVATLNSTGTAAGFMHAADALHGDLGIIREEDVIICISNSGSTPEIKVLVPLLRMRKNKLIAITGNKDSFLGSNADYTISTAVSTEASPDNLIPTSSTTAQLVMGDALAVAILECRGFTVGDFAKFHPGGSIGKKIYLKVNDLYPKNATPTVDINDPVRKVIVEISTKRLGATAVMSNGKLAGIITDGDLRRMLEKYPSIDNLTAGDITSPNPKTIDKNTLVVEALDLMRNNNITQLLVMDENRYMGVIHLHDILKEGIF